jgi:hypothetical protein
VGNAIQILATFPVKVRRTMYIGGGLLLLIVIILILVLLF